MTFQRRKEVDANQLAREMPALNDASVPSKTG